MLHAVEVKAEVCWRFTRVNHSRIRLPSEIEAYLGILVFKASPPSSTSPVYIYLLCNSFSTSSTKLWSPEARAMRFTAKVMLPVYLRRNCPNAFDLGLFLHGAGPGTDIFLRITRPLEATSLSGPLVYPERLFPQQLYPQLPVQPYPEEYARHLRLGFSVHGLAFNPVGQRDLIPVE
ncbi:hypothetical protein GALMADRAFT_205242 [Galerina marginata CBS 339.88]|uniref:Uncharacterized protein n=1 Tax=Galerina marginata (strain CBS 339.88) TaxID=685588 RepID=A0A067TS25_GALM3|nr:hypothetical protein GALMADRAFT_205242 [Galerina marginata CBS 339.88]